MQAASYSSLDDALEALAGYDIGLRNGNSNHGPMVVEAILSAAASFMVVPYRCW